MPEETGSSRDVYPGVPTVGSEHPHGGAAKPVSTDEKNTAGK
jgi:hypothetical protein